MHAGSSSVYLVVAAVVAGMVYIVAVVLLGVALGTALLGLWLHRMPVAVGKAAGAAERWTAAVGHVAGPEAVGRDLANDLEAAGAAR